MQTENWSSYFLPTFDCIFSIISQVNRFVVVVVVVVVAAVFIVVTFCPNLFLFVFIQKFQVQSFKVSSCEQYLPTVNLFDSFLFNLYIHAY